MLGTFLATLSRMFELRPFQKAALNALFTTQTKENHVLCISPTGSGKSLIYEKAVETKSLRSLLITPLIALGRQQSQKLSQKNLNVWLGTGGMNEFPNSKEPGIWIVSPETLLYPSKKAILKKWNPNFLVVDECHCLWEWGDQFRPAFSFIPNLVKEFSITKSLWLTATLPIDAQAQLKSLLPSSLTEIGKFDLPNRLHVWVKRTPWIDRIEVLAQWVQKHQEPGIIFVSTREDTYRLNRMMVSLKKKPVIYHGGLSVEERRNIEQQMANQVHDVIICTSAFGMGMDYHHLNHVVLWQAPPSILSLVQAIGRVGRHPEKVGQALLLWDWQDFKLLEWTVGHSKKRIDEMTKLTQFFSSTECRRFALQRYFDPNAALIPCLKCDSCAPHLHPLQ